MQKASQVLAELEDAFVATAVLNPAQIYIRDLRRAESASQFVVDHDEGIWNAVKLVFRAAWQIIKSDFDITSPIKTLEAVWEAIVEAIAEILYFAATGISGAFFLSVLTTLDLPVFKASFRKLLDHQKAAVKAAHDRALFQNQHVRRQRREKRTRS